MGVVVFPILLLINGLAAGVLVATQLGGWPLLRELPTRQYLHAHAFFSTRYDPFMPLCLVGTVVGDTVLVVFGTTPTSRWLTGLAGLCALLTITISLVKNVPLNRWVRSVDPDSRPMDLEERRHNWGGWNRIRTVLAVGALVSNCSGLALVLAA